MIVDDVSYSYDGPRFSKRNYPNGLTVDAYHGPDGRLFKWLHDRHGSDTSVVKGEEITQWNEAGFPEAIIDIPGTTASALVYDRLYRTTSLYSGIPVSKPEFPAAGENGNWNEYDEHGNLVGIRAGSLLDYSNNQMKVSGSRSTTRVFNKDNQGTHLVRER